MSPTTETVMGDPRSRWLGDPRRCLAADSALLALAVLTALACLTDAGTVVRPLLVLLAGCLIPGAALLTRLPVADPLEAAALAVVGSLCMEAVGALAMIWTGWWHPVGWALTLMVVGCAMFALDLRRNVALRDGR
jgi:uncharacterized membrane protein